MRWGKKKNSWRGGISLAWRWYRYIRLICKNTYLTFRPNIFFSISAIFPQKHTVRKLHFLSKYSTLISRENCRFFGVKNSWKCCGFGLFSCWQLWFHEKNCQKKFGVKNSWKCWGFVKIEFLDKNLTFRIVWNTRSTI